MSEFDLDIRVTATSDADAGQGVNVTPLTCLNTCPIHCVPTDTCDHFPHTFCTL